MLHAILAFLFYVSALFVGIDAGFRFFNSEQRLSSVSDYDKFIFVASLFMTAYALTGLILAIINGFVFIWTIKP